MKKIITKLTILLYWFVGIFGCIYGLVIAISSDYVTPKVFAGTLIIISLYFLPPIKQRLNLNIKLKYLGIAFLLTFIGALTTNKSHSNVELNEPYYITASTLNVREGDGTNYKVIYKLSKGDEVTIMNKFDKWVEIQSEKGRGFVSKKFISSTNSGDNNFNSIIIYILVGISVLALVLNFSSSNSSSSNGTTKPSKIPGYDPSRSSAVYRFRIKGSGSCGTVKYTDGMNIEVAVKGSSAKSSPFNTHVKDLFVQEFARKYNLEPNSHSSIKPLFNRDRLDVEIV